MNNKIANWWRSQQFKFAIMRGDTRLAVKLLQEIQKSGARFSWLEKLFRDKLQSEQSIHQYKQEVANLSSQIRKSFQEVENLKQKTQFYPIDSELVNHIVNIFKIIELDKNKLQCTGIDETTFYTLEKSLVEFLDSEFKKIKKDKLEIYLQDAYNDIEKLKSGKDPEYNLNLTPHVYFMKYFLQNVYGSYIAWFLIYKYGILPTQINILDIAAGPGTVAYGLALLLQSGSSYLSIPQSHISYYSLEEQAALQYRGLQFWRRYIEPHKTTTNAYFRFDTTNILNDSKTSDKLPKYFFDFIVISHCLFTDINNRIKSYQFFINIFNNSLKETGYVLLIIQGRKLFKVYEMRPSEDINQEKELINIFLKDLNLKLEWYKYLTSTGKRTSLGADFAKFASENLPLQIYMHHLLRQYLGIKHDSNYALDDYVILAKK